MKKYSIISLLFVMFLFSCNDFLTEIPESEYSVEGGYKTEDDFQQAIIGL
jgi:hypothetical protein